MSRIAFFRLYMQRNAFFFKVLLSYIVTGTILLSVMSYMMYESYSRNIKEEIEKHAVQMLGQSREVVETYWSSTLDYLNQIHIAHRDLGLNTGTNGSAALFYALYADNLNAMQMGEVSRKLDEIAKSNPIVQSVYVYNRRANLVFSNVAVSQPIESFFDQDIIARIGTIKDEISYVPRKMQYRLAADTTDVNTISVIYVEDSMDDVPVSILVFNLKQQALQRMVQPEPDMADETGQVFLMDRNGTVISHPQIDWFDRNMGDEPYIRSILESSDDKDIFTAEVSGRKKLITYNKSDSYFAWTFVSVGDYEMLLRKFTERQQLITLTTLAFILLSILVGIFFAGSFSKPLRRLLGKLRHTAAAQPAVASQKPLNEYDYLNWTFDYLVNNVIELEASVRAGRPAVLSDFLKQVLRGGVVNEEELVNQYAKLGIKLDGPLFVVCVLRIASYVTLREKLSARDQALFRFGLMNIGLEILAPDFRAEAVDAESDHVVLIVNVPDWSAETASAVRKRIAETQANIRRYLKITVTASFGSTVGRPKDIYRSYTEALGNSDYRLLFGKDAIIDHEEILAMEHEAYDYPSETEKMLLEAMKSADRTRMREAIDRFLSRALQFSYDGMLLALTQLVLSVIGTILPTGTEPDGGRLKLSYKTIIDELAACEDRDDIRNWLVSLCDNLMTMHRAKRDSKNRDLVDKMIQYVEERYQDANLSVEAISDSIGLSPNYIRTIFKNQTGQSLSSYIGDRRFAEARRLLLETNDLVGRISEAIGFTSAKYFYSAFKKATGYSPEEYRKKFRGQASP